MMKWNVFGITLAVGLMGSSLGVTQESDERSMSEDQSLPVFHLYFSGADLAREHSETELLVKHLGSESGQTFLSRLNGQLAGFLNDRLRASLGLATDKGLGHETMEGLLADIQHNESLIEIHYGDFQNKRLNLAIHLDEEARIRWIQAIKALENDPQGRLTDRFEWAGFPGGTSMVNNRKLAWIEAGSWLLVGEMDTSSKGLALMVERIKATGRPFHPERNALLTVQAALPSKTEPKSESQLRPLRLSLKITGTGKSLRTDLRLELNQSPPVEWVGWNPPKSIIKDPLIAFTASRGLSGILNASGLARFPLPEKVDDQFYAWAQINSMGVSGQSAMPAHGAGSVIESMAQSWVDAVNGKIQDLPLSQIKFNPENRAVYWENLPLLTPVVSPSPDDAFIRGILFPPNAAGGNPPDELYEQFLPKEGLVYYHWEMTGERGKQWQRTFQVLSLFSKDPPISLQNPSQKWLSGLFSELAETVTEISLGEGNNLLVVRRSKTFFTALELVSLAWWVEQGGFPEHKPQYPFQPLKTKSGLTNRPK